MTLRFQQGEMAICTACHPALEGQQVEITAVGPFKAGDIVTGLKLVKDADYLVSGRLSAAAGARDWQLRKINPPEEPASLTRTNEEEITA